jgi:hypothetical protein
VKPIVFGVWYSPKQAELQTNQVDLFAQILKMVKKPRHNLGAAIYGCTMQ